MSRAHVTLAHVAVAFLAAARAGARTFEAAPSGGYRFGGDLYEVYTGRPLDMDDRVPVPGGSDSRPAIRWWHGSVATGVSTS